MVLIMTIAAEVTGSGWTNRVRLRHILTREERARA